MIEPVWWRRILTGIFLRFVLLLGASLVLMHLGYATVLTEEPILAGVFLALALLIGIRRAANMALGRSVDLLCPALLLAAFAGAELLGAEGDVFLLVLSVLCLLVLILQDLPQLPQVLTRPDQPRLEINYPVQTRVSTGEVLMRHGDILIVLALVPDPALWLPYLIAKALSEVMVVIFDQMGDAAMPKLRDAFQAPRLHAFNAVSARLNLGFLLIGGGTTVLMIGLFKMFEPFLDGVAVGSSAILTWLLLGQCGPAIFGATGWIMKAGDLGRLNKALAGLSVVSTALVLLSVGFGDPLTFAKAFALCQLAGSALGAGLLVYLLGIWPGVTAVLFRQLKLL